MRRRLTGCALLLALVAAPLADASAIGLLLPAVQKVFGAVGIVQGQAVRVNVSNIRMLPASTEPGRQPRFRVPPGCPVQVSFLDMAGTVRKTADGSVMPGETAMFDVTPEEIQLGDGSVRVVRFPVRAVVALPPNPCADAIVATLEIVDLGTGQSTALLLPAVQKVREAAAR